MRISSLILLAALTMAGCSEQPAENQGKPATPNTTQPAAPAQPSTQPPPVSQTSPVLDYRILDQFEVGEKVYVRSFLVEPERQALWVGTSLGVHEINLQNLQVRQTFTREQGLANEYVFGIGRDRDGHIWFGTNAGGASRYKDGQWKTYFPMHGLADYWVYTFASHPDGHLWIGTWAGVSRFDPDSGKFTNFVKELVNEWVYAIAIDSKKRTWFGTEGGVSRFDGQEWRSWTHADGLGSVNTESLPNSINTGLGTRKRHDLGVLSGGRPTFNPNYVFSLVVNPDDTVWAGTWGGGVSYFDGQKWTNQTKQDGLPGNIIYSLIRTSDGDLWAGTENGIGRWHQGVWSPFADNGSLHGESVYAMMETPSGDIWAGLRGRVVRIGKSAQAAQTKPVATAR